MARLRWAAAGILLFLVVAVDFTSKLISVLADGVLVAGIVLIVWPLVVKTNQKQ